MVRMCGQQTTHLSAPSPPTPVLHASQLAASSLPPKPAVLFHRRTHPPGRDGAAPKHETVGPEKTDDELPDCWGITPQQPKREQANPPDVARNDLRDWEDRSLRCWGITPQHPRSTEWCSLITDQTAAEVARRQA